MTKNLHLEHPEDTILTGDRSALRWLTTPSDVSVKMDGAPAIVWGTNPENGKFFVGTKSVFNKKKIKICYTPDDINEFYSEQEEVAEILLTCLDFLPRTEAIYQGDFIGFGGESAYKPNTIIYDFGYDVEQQMIIAPHTVYVGDTIKDSVAEPLTDILDSTDDVLFVQPTVDSTAKLKYMETLNEQYNSAKFLSEKSAKEVKIIINSFIREGKVLTVEILSLIIGCETLASLYLNIMIQKSVLMDGMIVYDGPTTFLNGQIVSAEGFVRTNVYGSMKLVDRYQFARANFNNDKFRSIN